jgi:hypothetical protein
MIMIIIIIDLHTMHASAVAPSDFMVALAGLVNDQWRFVLAYG